jgi:hypothetical protein
LFKPSGPFLASLRAQQRRVEPSDATEPGLQASWQWKILSPGPLIATVRQQELMTKFVWKSILCLGCLMHPAHAVVAEDSGFDTVVGLWKISNQELEIVFEGKGIDGSTNGLYVLITEKAVFKFSRHRDRFYFTTVDRIYALAERRNGYVLLTRNASNERQARTHLKISEDPVKIGFTSRWSTEQSDFTMQMALDKITQNDDVEILSRIMKNCRFLVDGHAKAIVEAYLKKREAANQAMDRSRG